ncbi:MAG: hypothetical protein ACI9YB_000264, partial [Halioglobus sp.]
PFQKLTERGIVMDKVAAKIGRFIDREKHVI